MRKRKFSTTGYFPLIPKANGKVSAPKLRASGMNVAVFEKPEQAQVLVDRAEAEGMPGGRVCKCNVVIYALDPVEE